MKRFRIPILIILALAVAAAAGAVAIAQARGKSELASVRAATASFQQVENAMDAGWDFIASDCVDNPGVGGMGFHYVNTDLVDLTIEPEKPEVLVYAPHANGKLRLVAVEYMVPAAPWDAANDAPPTAHGHEMHLNPHLEAYVLHAWIWQNNPAGMFEDWNPRVSCS